MYVVYLDKSNLNANDVHVCYCLTNASVASFHWKTTIHTVRREFSKYVYICGINDLWFRIIILHILSFVNKSFHILDLDNEKYLVIIGYFPYNMNGPNVSVATEFRATFETEYIKNLQSYLLKNVSLRGNTLNLIEVFI